MIVPTLVQARRYVRAMRGVSEAHLLEADDGYRYVTKFHRCPEAGRTLVNEMVATLLFSALKISTPAPAVVMVDSGFLQAVPDLALPNSAQLALRPGFHFGSCYPGGRQETTVFDLFPTRMLSRVANLADFRGALVADAWLSNGWRQAIFFREPRTCFGPDSCESVWVAQMIDQKQAFQGSAWTFSQSAPGTSHQAQVYGAHPSLVDFEPWLEAVQTIRWETLDKAFHALPNSWIEGQEHTFLRLLRRLFDRRSSVLLLVNAAIEQIKGTNQRPFQLRAMSTELEAIV